MGAHWSNYRRRQGQTAFVGLMASRRWATTKMDEDGMRNEPKQNVEGHIDVRTIANPQPDNTQLPNVR